MTARSDWVVGSAAVLDIGDDVGALLVRLEDVPASGELHAEPSGRPSERFHTGVHRRSDDGHWVALALFPSVVAGRYDILDENMQPAATVDVSGGCVQEVDLGAARGPEL